MSNSVRDYEMTVKNLLRLLEENPIPKLSHFEVDSLKEVGKFLVARKILKSAGYANFVPCPNEDCTEMAELFKSSDGKTLLRQCVACNEVVPSSTEENIEFVFSLEELLEELRSIWRLEGSLDVIQTENMWLLGHKGGVNIVFVRYPSSSSEEIKKLSDSLFLVPTSKQLRQGFRSLDQFLSFDGKLFVLTDVQPALDVITGKSLMPSTKDRIVLHDEPKLEFETAANSLVIHTEDIKPETKKLGNAAGAILFFLYHQGIPSKYAKFFSEEELTTLPKLVGLQSSTIGNAISKLYNVLKNHSAQGFPRLIEKSLDGRNIRLNQELDCVLAAKRKLSQESSQGLL